MDAYIFDFDGTLVDSMPMWENMIRTLFKNKGVPFPHNLMKIITPLGQAESIKYLTSLDDRLKENEIVEFMYDFVSNQYANVIQPKKHVADLLNKLYTRGKRLFVLTACAHDLLDPCIERIGIDKFFEGVFTCEDLGSKKSDIDIYYKTAKIIGVETNNCYFFDDNAEALKKAHDSGMKTCGVFDSTSKDYVDEIKSFVDCYVYDFNEFGV